MGHILDWGWRGVLDKAGKPLIPRLLEFSPLVITRPGSVLSTRAS